jgi:hypothetical protein
MRSDPAPYPSRVHHSVNLNWRGYPLELLRAQLFDYEQAGEKAMCRRGYQHSVGSGGLRARSNIGSFAENIGFQASTCANHQRAPNRYRPSPKIFG